jgi:mono/diheme cytochrome c family protein
LTNVKKLHVLLCAGLVATMIEAVPVSPSQAAGTQSGSEAQAAGAQSGPEAQAAGARSGSEAQRAREIMEQKCYRCHGANGVAMKNVFVLDREKLLSSKAVIPGDPDSLLLRVTNSGAMPVGGPELSQEEKAALRDWVMRGAPGWGRSEQDLKRRPRLTESDILAFIRNDLLATPDRTRAYRRYFSLAHLYNAGVPEAELQQYREALSKLLNSLSWRREIAAPAAIDPATSIYRIDLRDYEWTAATWTEILSAYPYGVRTAQSQLITQLSGSDLPYVRADWFVANASAGRLYYDILGLPGSVQELERLLSVDVRRDLDEEKNMARAGLRQSGVSQNNRVLERHVTASGAYWKSFDFRSNLDSQNIFEDPLGFSPSGGEMIFNLPNGMQAYYLSDAVGRRLDEAPIAIVSDRNSPGDPVIRNGRSCISCHYSGMQGFRDEMRPIVTRMINTKFDREKALAIYSPQEDLDRFLETDRGRFEAAVKQAGVRAATSAQTEPINALSHRFFADISEGQAAAETGLDEQEFRARVSGSPRLTGLGYGQLLVAGGALKRDVWERNFGDMAQELQLGEYVPSKAVSLRRPATVAGFGPGRASLVKPLGIISADPKEILKQARTIFVMSSTVYLKPDQLENEMSKVAGFKDAGLVFVRDPRAADLKIELDRPVFTYTFTFVVTSTETSVLVMSGKVKAFDGNFAAPKIAGEILKGIQAARGR